MLRLPTTSPKEAPLQNQLPRFANLRSQAEIDAETRRAKIDALTVGIAHIVCGLAGLWALFLTVAIIFAATSGGHSLGDLIGAVPVDALGQP